MFQNLSPNLVRWEKEALSPSSEADRGVKEKGRSEQKETYSSVLPLNGSGASHFSLVKFHHQQIGKFSFGKTALNWNWGVDAGTLTPRDLEHRGEGAVPSLRASPPPPPNSFLLSLSFQKEIRYAFKSLKKREFTR